MAFKPGTKVIWLDTPADSQTPQVFEGVVKSASRDEAKLEGEEFPRYAAFLMVDTEEARGYCAGKVELIVRHRREADEMQAALYELMNEQTRQGLR